MRRSWSEHLVFWVPLAHAAASYAVAGALVLFGPPGAAPGSFWLAPVYCFLYLVVTAFGAVFGFMDMGPQEWRGAWPFWLGYAAAFALALWLLRRLWYRICPRPRRSPFGPGLGAACGYDLRATPGRCPECGREAATTPGAGS